MKPAALLWFRADLRLATIPPCKPPRARRCGRAGVHLVTGGGGRLAARRRFEVVAAPIAGGARRPLREAGSRLILRRGPALETLRALVKETGARAVYWNRRYEPAVVARDARVEAALRQEGLAIESFNAALLHEPWTIQNQAAGPSRSSRRFGTLPESARSLRAAARDQETAGSRKVAKSLALEALELEPRINWTEGLRAAWRPGEAVRRKTCGRFWTAPSINTPINAIAQT